MNKDHNHNHNHIPPDSLPPDRSLPARNCSSFYSGCARDGLFTRMFPHRCSPDSPPSISISLGPKTPLSLLVSVGLSASMTSIDELAKVAGSNITRKEFKDIKIQPELKAKDRSSQDTVRQSDVASTHAGSLDDEPKASSQATSGEDIIKDPSLELDDVDTLGVWTDAHGSFESLDRFGGPAIHDSSRILPSVSTRVLNDTDKDIDPGFDLQGICADIHDSSHSLDQFGGPAVQDSSMVLPSVSTHGLGSSNDSIDMAIRDICANLHDSSNSLGHFGGPVVPDSSMVLPSTASRNLNSGPPDGLTVNSQVESPRVPASSTQVPDSIDSHSDAKSQSAAAPVSVLQQRPASGEENRMQVHIQTSKMFTTQRIKPLLLGKKNMIGTKNTTPLSKAPIKAPGNLVKHSVAASATETIPRKRNSFLGQCSQLDSLPCSQVSDPSAPNASSRAPSVRLSISGGVFVDASVIGGRITNVRRSRDLAPHNHVDEKEKHNGVFSERPESGEDARHDVYSKTTAKIQLPSMKPLQLSKLHKPESFTPGRKEDSSDAVSNISSVKKRAPSVARASSASSLSKLSNLASLNSVLRQMESVLPVMASTSSLVNNEKVSNKPRAVPTAIKSSPLATSLVVSSSVDSPSTVCAHKSTLTTPKASVSALGDNIDDAFVLDGKLVRVRRSAGPRQDGLPRATAYSSGNHDTYKEPIRPYPVSESPTMKEPGKPATFELQPNSTMLSLSAVSEGVSTVRTAQSTIRDPFEFDLASVWDDSDDEEDVKRPAEVSPVQAPTYSAPKGELPVLWEQNEDEDENENNDENENENENDLLVPPSLAHDDPTPSTVTNFPSTPISVTRPAPVSIASTSTPSSDSPRLAKSSSKSKLRTATSRLTGILRAIKYRFRGAVDHVDDDGDDAIGIAL